jgi:RNA polymerase sigma factor (sigma-70 family)
MAAGRMSMVHVAPESASPAVSDDALLERLRGGDSVSGETLVRRHSPALLHYLQRIAGEQLAEELHQQTWLSVLDHIDKFDPSVVGGGFKAWLFRIATNKANDLWRSRGREKAAKEGMKLIREEEGPAAGNRMESSEQTQKLRRAVESLPDAQRQVLMLRYYSDLKFVEIAEIVGCPLNTALGRMHKAMIKLKQLMEQ